MKSPSLFRWLAGLALSGAAALAMAGNAADLLKSVVDLRASLTQEAQEKAKANGSRIDYLAIQKQVRAKAEESVKGVDSTKIDVAEALEWAQLFSMAGKPQDAKVVLNGYIASKPDSMKLYQAQSMLLNASSATQDAATMASTLQAMKPYNKASTLGFASLTSTYAPRIAATIGADAAVALIDKGLASIDEKGLNAQEKTRVAAIQNGALLSKIDIYKAAGQKDKALATIDEALRTAPDAAKARLTTMRNQLVLVGSAAPSLAVERGYGDFPGLASLKGKVVVMDFFAHWCGPCKAAFPDMRQMYADLRSQGLEMVGVTTYYGYIGDPATKLTPDEEYAKMAQFVKDQNMTWPVVFGDRSNFEAYGVTAIPHVVVVGRDGRVHKLEIGYSKEIFAKFRAEIEALLAEK